MEKFREAMVYAIIFFTLFFVILLFELFNEPAKLEKSKKIIGIINYAEIVEIPKIKGGWEKVLALKMNESNAWFAIRQNLLKESLDSIKYLNFIGQKATIYFIPEGETISEENKLLKLSLSQVEIKDIVLFSIENIRDEKTRGILLTVGGLVFFIFIMLILTFSHFWMEKIS